MIVEQLRKFNSTKTLPTASSERVFFGICGASFPAFIIRWPMLEPISLAGREEAGKELVKSTHEREPGCP